MEKNRKELKSFSILILALVALSLIRAIVNVCLNGVPQISATEGLTKEMIQVVSIIALVVSLLLLLPQIYVGVKGIKIANGAPSGKAHIVWAIILAVCAVIALISAISALIKAFNFDSILNLIDPAVDVAAYVFYYIYARRVAC